MGRNYYYFAATLSLLIWEGKPPLAVNDFLADAQRLMSFEDYDLISALLADDDRKYFLKTGNQAVCAWAEFDRTFRNETAWVRAQAAGKDPSVYLRGERGLEPRWSERIYEASRASDPLAAEKILDFARWQFLEELGAGHYFDFEFLMVYALKLKILQRYQKIHSSKGGEILEEIKQLKISV